MTGYPPAEQPAQTDTSDPVADDYRKHLQDALHAASRDYDQAILTLGAGTLALSVTFVHNITPTPVAGTQTILVVAWGALVVSLVCIVISFLTSQHLIRRQIRALDGPRPGTRTLFAHFRDWLGGKAAPVTGVLNFSAGLSLVAGLALLGWYALANIPTTPAP